MKSHVLIAAVMSGLLFFCGEAVAKRMTFTETGNGGNCNECGYIVADGDIAIDSVDDFRAVGGSYVLINSNGGSVTGAIALGEEFRRRGVKVTVTRVEVRDGGPWSDSVEEGDCLSACVYAFFGAVERVVPPKSMFGIHAFAAESDVGSPTDPLYSRLELTAAQRLTGVLLEYTQRMGVDPLVVDWAARQENSSMRILTREELLRLKIVWNAILAQPLRLEAYRAGLLATSSTVDGEGKVTLLCSGRELRLIFAKPRAPDSGEPRSKAQGDHYEGRMNIFAKKDDADFGEWIETDYKVTADKSTTYYSVALANKPVADILKSKMIDISLGQIRGEVENRLLRLPTDGLPKIIPLLSRNCV